MDKSEQASDWARRPLTDAQVTYAPLDAEVLLRLGECFKERRQNGTSIAGR